MHPGRLRVVGAPASGSCRPGNPGGRSRRWTAAARRSIAALRLHNRSRRQSCRCCGKTSAAELVWRECGCRARRALELARQAAASARRARSGRIRFREARAGTADRRDRLRARSGDRTETRRNMDDRRLARTLVGADRGGGAVAERTLHPRTCAGRYPRPHRIGLGHVARDRPHPPDRDIGFPRRHRREFRCIARMAVVPDVSTDRTVLATSAGAGRDGLAVRFRLHRTGGL